MPYPGLRSFTREETDLFFGRDGCIDRMVDKLGATKFLAVLGASGSGKSSLVKTGLVSALQMGLLPKAGSRWLVAEFRPGDHPLRSLAAALVKAEGEPDAGGLVEATESFLRRGPRSIIEHWSGRAHPEGTNLLLIADQFEELFRYGDYGSREEAEALVRLLIETANSDQSIYVVITMRSEFLGACGLIPKLAEQINNGLFLAPRMTREECREAIVGPANVCGIKISEELVTVLLNDLAVLAPWNTGELPEQIDSLIRRSDQLPLMQHVLNRMCAKAAAGGTAPIELTLDHYRQCGGIEGALNAHAAEVVDALDPSARDAVEWVFRSLVDGNSVEEAVRRPTKLREIIALNDGDERGTVAAIDAFRARDCNFLSPSSEKSLNSESIIDISHESLIRQWSQLRQWQESEARAAQTWRRLTTAQGRHAENEGGLLSGPDLFNVETWWRSEQPTSVWAERYGNRFSEVRSFIDRSQEQADRARSAEQKAERRIFLFKSGFALLAAVIAIGAGLGAYIYSLYNTSQDTIARSIDIFVSGFARNVASLQYGDRRDEAGQLLTEFNRRVATISGFDTRIAPGLKAQLDARLLTQRLFGPIDSQIVGGGDMKWVNTTPQSPYQLYASKDNSSIYVVHKLTGAIVRRLANPIGETGDEESFVSDDATQILLVKKSEEGEPTTFGVAGPASTEVNQYDFKTDWNILDVQPDSTAQDKVLMLAAHQSQNAQSPQDAESATETPPENESATTTEDVTRVSLIEIDTVEGKAPTLARQEGMENIPLRGNILYREGDRYLLHIKEKDLPARIINEKWETQLSVELAFPTADGKYVVSLTGYDKGKCQPSDEPGRAVNMASPESWQTDDQGICMIFLRTADNMRVASALLPSSFTPVLEVRPTSTAGKYEALYAVVSPAYAKWVAFDVEPEGHRLTQKAPDIGWYGQYFVNSEKFLVEAFYLDPDSFMVRSSELANALGVKGDRPLKIWAADHTFLTSRSYFDLRGPTLLGIEQPEEETSPATAHIDRLPENITDSFDTLQGGKGIVLDMADCEAPCSLSLAQITGNGERLLVLRGDGRLADIDLAENDKPVAWSEAESASAVEILRIIDPTGGELIGSGGDKLWHFKREQGNWSIKLIDLQWPVGSGLHLTTPQLIAANARTGRFLIQDAANDLFVATVDGVEQLVRSVDRELAVDEAAFTDENELIVSQDTAGLAVYRLVDGRWSFDRLLDTGIAKSAGGAGPVTLAATGSSLFVGGRLPLNVGATLGNVFWRFDLGSGALTGYAVAAAAPFADRMEALADGRVLALTEGAPIVSTIRAPANAEVNAFIVKMRSLSDAPAQAEFLDQGFEALAAAYGKAPTPPRPGCSILFPGYLEYALNSTTDAQSGLFDLVREITPAAEVVDSCSGRADIGTHLRKLREDFTSCTTSREDCLERAQAFLRASIRLARKGHGDGDALMTLALNLWLRLRDDAYESSTEDILGLAMARAQQSGSVILEKDLLEYVQGAPLLGELLAATGTRSKYPYAAAEILLGIEAERKVKSSEDVKRAFLHFAKAELLYEASARPAPRFVMERRASLARALPDQELIATKTALEEWFRGANAETGSSADNPEDEALAPGLDESFIRSAFPAASEADLADVVAVIQGK